MKFLTSTASFMSVEHKKGSSAQKLVDLLPEEFDWQEYHTTVSGVIFQWDSTIKCLSYSLLQAGNILI